MPSRTPAHVGEQKDATSPRAKRAVIPNRRRMKQQVPKLNHETEEKSKPKRALSIEREALPAARSKLLVTFAETGSARPPANRGLVWWCVGSVGLNAVLVVRLLLSGTVLGTEPRPLIRSSRGDAGAVAAANRPI